jgi:hypothetical protein
LEDSGTVIPQLIEKNHVKLLSDWLACQHRDGAFRDGQTSSAAASQQSTRFLAELRHGVEGGHFDDITTPQWGPTAQADGGLKIKALWPELSARLLEALS